MEASSMITQETNKSEILRILELQRANKQIIADWSAKERSSKLKKLQQVIIKYKLEIRDAVFNDCRRHGSEVDMTETYPVIAEIKHARAEIHRWMKDKYVGTPFALFGSSSRIKYEPKGNVLIISPWNFPFNLCLSPLVSAIAAGNTVIIKPSEFTPHCTQMIKVIIDECFDESEVTVAEGGAETSKFLLEQKFDHIFFTGSPEIGKIVMKAAAEHLCSVTLELGGKSPTIVDQTANLSQAAKRIAMGKFVNNGQICIAPDYILVHHSIEEEFCDKLKQYINEFYGDAKYSESYSRIIDERHFDRMHDLLKSVKESSSEIICGGVTDREQCYISPTVIRRVELNSEIMNEEIFGPLLPVISYKDLNEVIEIIDSKEKPLALYIFSNDNKTIEYILDNTRSGASCINHTGVHFYNCNLPFGGVNNSGIGKSHGKYGFMEFSNAKAIFRQHIPNALDLLTPPYNNFKQKLIDLTLKYF